MVQNQIICFSYLLAAANNKFALKYVGEFILTLTCFVPTCTNKKDKIISLYINISWPECQSQSKEKDCLD